MTTNDVIKNIMTFRGHTYRTLATKLGKSTPSAVSNKVSRPNGMRIDMFIEMIEAMDCELIVQSKLKDNETWKISPLKKEGE